MEIDKNIFKRDNKEYSRHLEPVKDYIEQATNYVSIKYGYDLKTSRDYVIKKLKSSELDNPEIVFNHKNSLGDLVLSKCSTTDYLKGVIDNCEMLAPSWTSYLNHHRFNSIHAQFLAVNVKKRSEAKKLAFKYEQLKDEEKYSYYNNLQKKKKVDNNSLSGAYASPSTILYNPSSHSTLTSMTRCIATIGNGITESVVAGNKLFLNPEDVFNYITSIITYVNMNDVKIVCDKYNLYLPNSNEVFEVLYRSMKPYYTSEIYVNKIKEYLNRLNKYQLAAITYVNDLYDLAMFNGNLIRHLIDSIKDSKTGLSMDLKYVTDNVEGVEILSRIINADYIKGMSINYKDNIDKDILDRLISTAYNIYNNLLLYKDLFRTFFTTDILPINMSYIKNMLRKCIVLSDTDSTCASYDQWVKWYNNGEIIYNHTSVVVSAIIMTINTQVMDHNIKILSKNMNVPNEKLELLKMKNEFYWSSFTTANVSKHYFAETGIQEGNVYQTPKLELKGAHFIASNVNQDIVKIIHNMIVDYNTKVRSNIKVSLNDYLVKMANLEKEIINSLLSSKIDMYGRLQIKHYSGYKNEKHRSHYFHHMVWNEVFGDKYGMVGEPPYYAFKIPTIVDTKKRMNEFLENMEDKTIANKLRNMIEKYGKEQIAIYYIPHSIMITKGIPDEIKPIINTYNVISDTLKSGYMFLESIGFYLPPNRLIHTTLNI
jgi:DNA-directed RNA polymerase subunit L